MCVKGDDGGGGDRPPKAIRSVECYDFEEGRWFQVAELPSRRCRAGELHAHIIDNDWQNDSPWSHIQQLCMLEHKLKIMMETLGCIDSYLLTNLL